MRRLRIAGNVVTELRCTFTPAGRERRRRPFDEMFVEPATLGVMLAPLTGPDAVRRVFSDENIGRILSLA